MRLPVTGIVVVLTTFVASIGDGLMAAELVPAQQGLVTGTVVDERARPIQGARVEVVGTDLQTTTDAGGRFRIPDATGTQVTLRVTSIGYRPLTQTVKVDDIDTRLILLELPINLEEIVVTGTAGETQRRSIGNAITKIDAGGLQELAPVTKAMDLLKGQAASVNVNPSSGATGEGGRIRIRGVNSLSLQNEPLIYIDGVRVDNGDRTTPGGNVWQSAHRLNDLPLQDIESIEVIKGPSAATLYGTEAANGVIQIITKRGRVGRPIVNAAVERGANWVPNPEGRLRTHYRRNADGSIFAFNPVQSETDRGTPVFTTGQVQQYGLDVAGGTETLRYFIGAGWENEAGTVAPNALDRLRLRTNLTAKLNPTLEAGVNLGYTAARTDFAGMAAGVGFAWWPGMTTAAQADGRGFGLTLSPDEFRTSQSQFENVDRFTGGLLITHNPRKWFSQRLTVGIDKGMTEQNIVTERQGDPDILRKAGSAALGYRLVDNRTAETNTVDYTGTVTADLTKRIQSKTSVGGQYYRQYVELNSVQGFEFPAPGVSAVNAAARKVATGTFNESITVGMYVQQQFSLNDRLYLTAAIRADDNSAFGEDFNLVTYPKASVAWVMSEEPFWPFKWINTFRLRGAYGESGKQPVSFAALRVYQPYTAPGDRSGVRPLSVGNPLLGPERGKELEAGFEATMFGGRGSIEFNYYDKRTTDLILDRLIPPSAGFPGAQTVNIGEVKNTGIELQLKAAPLEKRNLRWDLGLIVAQNDNKVVDMGGVPPVSVVTQQTREGFAIMSFFGPSIVSADVSVDPATNLITVRNVMCDGGTGPDHLLAGGAPVPCAQAPSIYLGRPTPEWEGSLTSNLTLFNRLTVYGMVDYAVNVWAFDWTNFGPCAASRQCAVDVVPDSALANPIKAAGFTTTFGRNVHPDRSYARLRQVSASLSLPTSWARVFGASAASMTLTARNLWVLWTRNYEGLEPDVGTRFGGGSGSQYYINFQPTPLNRQLIASLRLAF